MVDRLLSQCITISGKPVKFVGTATAGFDHVDTAWLEQQKIAFSSAPGCNAIAVVEYVFSALMVFAGARRISINR